jgi:8-oxo-dGTP pyrophosphatase MutT (NUDIX family)
VSIGAGPTVDGAWLARLRARVAQPPMRARVPLLVETNTGVAAVGSVEPDLFHGFDDARAGDGQPLLQPQTGERMGWLLHGEPTDSLHRLAHALRDAGLAHVWRDEQLAVADAQDRRVATVERAVVRPLGITTHAVHLVGFDPRGHVWLQQRAFTKPNDPGLWDTLMGGMVAAVDDHDTALTRETWEEAGLVITEMRDLRYGGRVTIRRPSSDAGGKGYVVEHIDWSVCTVPSGMAPVNQDGEVERFELLASQQVIERLHADAFTDEAALILVAALGA